MNRTLSKTTGKAAAFKAISQARRSCKRFVEHKVIEPDVLRDILLSTIVSSES